jgi:hypothetical protein
VRYDQAAAGGVVLSPWEHFGSARQDAWEPHRLPLADAPTRLAWAEASPGGPGRLVFIATVRPVLALVSSPSPGTAGDSGAGGDAPSAERPGVTASPDLPDANAPAVAAAAALADGPERQATQATSEPAGSVASPSAALYAALLTVAERQTAESRPAAVPVPAGAASVNRGARFPEGRDDAARATRQPVPRSGSGLRIREGMDGPEQMAFPQPKAPPGGVPALAPQAAGLLTDAVFSGLATLERAVQNLTEPVAGAAPSGAALLYWLGLSSWLVAGVLAWEAFRRCRVAPAPALLGGEPDLPEDPS